MVQIKKGTANIFIANMWRRAGADPGFPVGGAVPRGKGGGGCHQHMILSNFLKNCMKSRKFWTVWGARQGCPP